MRGPKNLAEWLESQGNPKHFIAEGENGSKVMAVENKSFLTPGVTLYNFRETDLPNGGKSFQISSGLGIRKEYLPALKGLINNGGMTTPYGETFWFEVLVWGDDEAVYIAEFIDAFTKAHAEIILRNGIQSGKYPKGAWIERNPDTDKLAKEHGFTTSHYNAGGVA
jgi:hypothetical protein